MDGTSSYFSSCSSISLRCSLMQTLNHTLCYLIHWGQSHFDPSCLSRGICISHYPASYLHLLWRLFSHLFTGCCHQLPACHSERPFNQMENKFLLTWSSGFHFLPAPTPKSGQTVKLPGAEHLEYLRIWNKKWQKRNSGLLITQSPLQSLISG